MDRSGHVEMRLLGVRVQLPSGQPLVLLKEEAGPRYLPLWIGQHEAGAIAALLQGTASPRPSTHHLVLNTVHALDQEVLGATITDFRDHVFYAHLELTDGIEVACRASDALAVCAAAERALYCEEAVLEECGILVQGDDDPEAQVDAFKRFLDQVAPEDFGTP